MSEIDLQKLFSSNYNIYKEIATKHTVGIYDIDIVMSNLYIHLYKFIDGLNIDNIESYVVKFSYGLKKWRSNRHYFITERSNKKIDFLTNENVIVSGDFEDDVEYDILDNIADDDDYNYIELFELYLEEYKSTLSKEDMLLIKDFYDHNIDDYKKVKIFYGFKSKRYCFIVLKRIREVESGFRDYIKNKLNYVRD